MEHQWKETERGKPKYKKKNLPQCLTILFTTYQLTHCGRVTQICVFNTVNLSTSASSP